jgi:hypothetical protein
MLRRCESLRLCGKPIISLLLSMHKTRRKKILLFLLCFIILLLSLGYIFRYPLILQFQYSRLRPLGMERIWVHRVNSVERYELLKDKFYGFETDIAYNSDTRSFYVYHPPLTRNTDTLSLSRFLAKVDLTQKHIWLDTREVSASNMNEALEAMSKLGDSAVMRRCLLIELYDIDAARLFAQNGYIVSFRVDNELIPRLLANKQYLDSVTKALNEVEYVSQGYRHIFTLKKLFPYKPLLTWDTRFKSSLNRRELKRLLNEKHIEVILMNIKSRHYK